MNQGRGSMGVMLLVANVLRVGLDHIPPVTLGVIALCTALELNLFPMFQGLSNDNACFNYMVLASALGLGGLGFGGRGLLSMDLPVVKTSIKKLFLSNFFHANDFHLYYNMMSWLYKARNYELVYGSEVMLLWLLCAMVGVSAVYVTLCTAILYLLPSDPSFLGSTLTSWLEPNACVVGFSGIIFCLKTVLNYYNVQAQGEIDEQIFIPFFGPLFNTPLRHAVWAELLVCQLFSSSQVSFLGHLSGILCGMLFISIDLIGMLRPVAEMLRDVRRGAFAAPPRGGGGGHPHAHPQQQQPPRHDRDFYGIPRGQPGGFG